MTALAFAHSAALGGWLDGEQPRAFWTLLAVAVPLTLGQLAMSALATLLSPEASSSLFSLTSPLYALLSALVAFAALAAYARYSPAHPSDMRD